MVRSNQNQKIYDRPDVVETYGGRLGLQPVEQYAFDKYIPAGSAILDIGIGAGRTTPFLAEKASRYVGVDYAPRMVEAARERFPGLTILCESACDLGRFEAATFDIVVFSFNGIGSIGSDERLRALSEISRVLRRGGMFIFSVQNPRAVIVWPLVDRKVSREFREIASAAGKTASLTLRRLFSSMFYSGAGYAADPAHGGGLSNFFATPKRIRAELGSAGLSIVEVIGGYYPMVLTTFSTHWYNYVAMKSGDPGAEWRPSDAQRHGEEKTGVSVGMNRNLDTYDKPLVVGEYAARQGLQPAEAYTFGKYVSRGKAILDIGVGAGRTTPYLSNEASHYVGIDYAPRMIEVCKTRFPGLSFFCMNACDLGRFGDASFDLVVFPFNGIGSIGSDSDRRQALAEISRVMRPGGQFIFSLQNPRQLLSWPILRGTRRTRLRQLWGAARTSLALTSRRLFSDTYRRGAGYDSDAAHGGLTNFFATPEVVRNELAEAGLTIVEIVNGYFPHRLSRPLTPWYYYVAAKQP